jgi:UDP-4-amino-4,6-dideoxy-N-acetyl-beta-L-altrosamine transaminase
MIPYGRQLIDEADIEAVISVLRSDLITQGPSVTAFEEGLCVGTGARFAVAVSSGTAALHLACLAAGVGEGDEVVTSPITFAASANCALYCGAKPVFADIEPDCTTISPAAFEKAITEHTRAVIPVHFAGHPCDMAEIFRIAQRRGITVIEDAAHALGAGYPAKGTLHKIGSCSHSAMTVLSFHPVKHITTGEGGAILTNDAALHRKLAMLRTHGITREILAAESPGEWYYEMQSLGYNYRITDIQAALGLSQLKKLDGFIARRRAIAELYDGAFADNPYIESPLEKDGYFSSYHLYVIRLRDPHHARRSAIFSELRREGIGVQVHYIPVYHHPYYRQSGYGKADCPEAENYYRRCISIPIHPSMTDGDVETVIDAVRRAAAGK